MAKASNLRAAPAVADAVVVRNKTKPAIGAPKKQRAATKKAAVKSKAAAAGKPAVAKSSPPKKAVAQRNASRRPAERAASKKISPPRKTAAAPATKTSKKAGRRRPASRVAVPIPTARRGPPAAARQAAGTLPGKALVRPPQVFTVSHLSQDDFKVDGLRRYARYRDLGFAAATGGLCQAHVIRFTPPCTDEVRQRHVHEAELQLIYVLQGWMKNEFEGHGEQMMSAGSCWLQPSGIKHTVLDYSADCEVLEIIVPADFKTAELT